MNHSILDLRQTLGRSAFKMRRKKETRRDMKVWSSEDEGRMNHSHREFASFTLSLLESLKSNMPHQSDCLQWILF